MVFFLSAEVYNGGASYWLQAKNKIQPKLQELKHNNYGDCLNSIAIISIILPEEYFAEGGYKERRLFKRKTKEADIRLKINYNEFCKANETKRLSMYAHHVIESVQTLENKVDSRFAFSQFIDDLEKALSCFL